MRIVVSRPDYDPRRVPPLLSGVPTTADHSGEPRLSVGAGGLHSRLQILSLAVGRLGQSSAVTISVTEGARVAPRS